MSREPVLQPGADPSYYAVRTTQEVAEIMTARGCPMTTRDVYRAEQRALSKLGRLLLGFYQNEYNT